MTDRQDLRRQLRAYRRTLSAADRLRAAEGVAEHLHGCAPLLSAQRVAGYWAVDGELPLHEVVGHVLRRGQTYCLPVLEVDPCLRFRSWRNGEALTPNRFGIPEPSGGTEFAAQDIDVVILPLLAFDHAGNRLGSGAGYYDRTFAFRRGTDPGRPFLLGVGYAFQLREGLPAADWDVPLDAACTDAGLIDCRAARGV
ncbi:MAG TPA: 5-formyltetrahydrofolate cyclo-ligase [Xanthomonadaceae bacterium]|nr:5-formyltetrahydrofolate cyclo-ligase [Xanthomonadaceae bacterium]